MEINIVSQCPNDIKLKKITNQFCINILKCLSLLLYGIKLMRENIIKGYKDNLQDNLVTCCPETNSICFERILSQPTYCWKVYMTGKKG